MKVKITPKTAVYIIWQRTRYTKDLILHRLAFRLNHQLPFLAYPCFYLLALIKKGYIENLFNADIQADFNSIVRHLPKNLTRSLDIGAGVSGIGAFLSEYYNHEIKLHLLDKTAINKSIYYGFEDKAAFYNSLPLASELLVNNGVPKGNIFLHEVGDNTNSPFENNSYDLITSFISWGFHYPLDTYLNQVKKSLSPEGILIVDLHPDGEEFAHLQREFKEVSVIYEAPYLRRVLAKKPRTV